MNLMEKLAASHMSEEAFKAWGGAEQEKAAGKVSDFLKAVKGKAKGTGESIAARLGKIGQPGKKVRMGKGMAARIRKDEIALGKKRALIGGGALAGAGALAAGAKAMGGKKKGYKERM